MFGYLRVFVIISLLAVVGLAVSGGMFLRNLAIDDLAHLIEASNTSLSQGYVNAVWKKYHDSVLAFAANPAAMKDSQQIVDFAQDTVRYFQQMPLVRVNIYSNTGLLLMTDNVAVLNKLQGKATSPDKEFVLAQMARGTVASQVLQDVPMQNVEHGKLVQTLIPFHADGGDNRLPEGAVEILFNITDAWNKVMVFQFVCTNIVICVFLIFLLILSFTSRKAESIIAKQYEANLELTQTAAAAQAENRDKSQFLANISHELRTPLNAIIGFSDIIKNELMPKIEERKYDQYVNDIHSSGVHLLSLINDILDFSKAEAGKLTLEISEVDVTKLIQNSMRLLGPRAESASVQLIEQMPKEHIIMTLDGKKFKQILLNLLSNAVKFTPAGGQISVTCWCNLDEDSVTIEVQDTGIGIAPKDISRAMSPFGQVDNTLKRKYEGTGLGLPLTKKFVELMGGKFTIESELNRGTKVIFTLPRIMQERDDVTIKHAS